MHARRVDSSALCFGLSSHRHSYIGFDRDHNERIMKGQERCRIRSHTSAYVRIRQDTSGYVRIRQDTSGYGVPVCESEKERVCVCVCIRVCACVCACDGLTTEYKLKASYTSSLRSHTLVA